MGDNNSFNVAKGLMSGLRRAGGVIRKGKTSRKFLAQRTDPVTDSEALHYAVHKTNRKPSV